MALFNDQPLNRLTDLQNYESRILDVAAAEGIDLGGKIALAQDEIASELMTMLLRRLPAVESQWLPPWTVRQEIGVSDVVVTPPLRQWHAHRTLALVYRDAYNNQLNDRYRGKWDEYEQLAKTSSRQYFQIGVGLVAGPISRPSAPVVDTIAGNGLPGTYYVGAAWVGEAGQESSISEIAEISLLSGQQLRIAVPNPPAIAKGWNVYVGDAPATISRQNNTTIAIGSAWMAAGPIAQGQSVPEGQQPSWYIVDQRVIQRG